MFRHASPSIFSHSLSRMPRRLRRTYKARHKRLATRRITRRTTRRNTRRTGLRKQRGGALKDAVKDAILNVANKHEVRAFLAGMEIPQAHAGFPRGPYEGNKYVYALLAPVDEQDEPNNYNMTSYDHPQKIIVMEMKVDGENVSDLLITLHPNKVPNTLDDQYPPGRVPGANNYSLTHGDNPIANAIEHAVETVKQIWKEEEGPAGV